MQNGVRTVGIVAAVVVSTTIEALSVPLPTTRPASMPTETEPTQIPPAVQLPQFIPPTERYANGYTPTGLTPDVGGIIEDTISGSTGEILNYMDGIATEPPRTMTPIVPVTPRIVMPVPPVNLFRQYLSHQPQTTDYLPAPLKTMLVQVAQRCSGFQVVATGCWRGGHSLYINGTNRVSLHCLNRAADFHVNNYGCAYNVINSHHWQGGVNADAAMMNHIHISWSPHGREWTGGDPCRAFYHHGGIGCIGPSYASATRRRVRVVHVQRVRHVRYAHVHHRRAQYTEYPPDYGYGYAQPYPYGNPYANVTYTY